jgi:putative ABC transport system permease protein
MGLSHFDLLNLTYRSLRSNPLRSVLTALGVFMGVASVSATLQVGSISRAVIAQQLAERDIPQVVVGLESESDQSTEMSLEDMDFLRQRLVGLRVISASNVVGPSQTLFQTKEASPFMLAVSQDFLVTLGRPLVAGRFFTSADFESYRSVTVIDQFLVDKLKMQEPIGQLLYVEGKPYVVVGVVPTKLEGDAPPEGQLVVPISVYSTLKGNRSIHIIQLRPNEVFDLEALGNQAKQLLAQRFPGRNFWVWNNVEDILQQQKIFELASQALAVVGMISLLVGGVGIANIMIAAVAERTPEIGLRRALGATRRDILVQFVLEAALLSLLGGTAALGVVHGLTVAVTEAFELPYHFEGKTAVLALGSALLVGVGAGFPPALRASHLEPVKALRAE